MASGRQRLHGEELLDGQIRVAGTQVERSGGSGNAEPDGRQQRVGSLAELLQRDGEQRLEDSLAALHRLVGGLQRLLLALARRHFHVEHDEDANHRTDEPGNICAPSKLDPKTTSKGDMIKVSHGGECKPVKTYEFDPTR